MSGDSDNSLQISQETGGKSLGQCDGSKTRKHECGHKT